MTASRLLMVLGFGLSGELDLTYSLAAHPSVVLGIHRYRALWEDRLDEVGPHLFERERFLDLGDGLTDLTPDDERWRRHYDAMAAGWDQATFVGDMTTEVRPQQLWERLPDARLVCIVRDPVSTVLARERRAAEQGRLLPPGATERNVAGWCRSGTRIRRAARLRPDRVRVLEHERFLSDVEGTSLNSLLRWLDLEDTEPSDRAFNAAHRRWLADQDRPAPDLPESELAGIRAADPGLWRDLQALAV